MDIVKIENPNDSFDVLFTPVKDTNPELDETWVHLVGAIYAGVMAHVENEALAATTAEGELRNMQKFLSIDSPSYYVNKILSVRVLYNVLKRVEGPLTGIVTIAYERLPEVDVEEGRKKDGKVRLIGVLPKDVMDLMREAYYQKFPQDLEKARQEKPSKPPRAAVPAAAPVRLITGRDPVVVVNHALMQFSHDVNRAVVTRSPKELSFVINQSIQRLRDELLGGLMESPRINGHMAPKSSQPQRRPNPQAKVGG